MKKIAIFSALATLLAACVPAEDLHVTTTGPEPVVLTCSGDVVLQRESNPNLALTLNWTDNNNIGTTGVAAAPKNATVNTLQFSATEDFAKTYDHAVAKGATSAQFTVESLNTLSGRLGLKGGVKSSLYIRLASALSATGTPVYSNTVTVGVTPYEVDLSVAHILNSSHEDTGAVLRTLSEGVYGGFMGVSSWYNWFLLEGSGTEWGNLGQDGFPFYLSSASDKWNFWFPGQAGCYYTVVDTKKAEWSALYIPSLSVSGDISGDMVFDKASNSWILGFNATAAGSVTVRISGTGKQYNIATGTDDTKATDAPVGFGGTADAVTFGEAAADLTATVAGTGEVSLILDLGAMTLRVDAGGVAPVEVPQQLYLVGINDGWTNKDWDFDNYLTLFDEDNLAYGGACNVNSKWGYRYYTIKDTWSDFYGMESGDFTSGTLVANTETNIPAPETPGLYLMTVSLSGLSYTNTAISTVQIAGVGKDTGWELLDMTPGETAGVYSLAIPVEDKTPWGFKIYINGWDYFFGGSDGILRYNADGCPLDDSYIGSTCLFTVDICKGTYSIEKQ